MERQKIDVLLMQNNNDFMGGYVKWFSDIPAVNGYPVSLVFPRDAGMTVVRQGPMNLDRRILEEDAELRGVDRVIGVASYASAGFSLRYEVEAVEKALRPYAAATIGIVGIGTMPMSMIDSLRGTFTKARFVDASDWVDQIKSIKSAEEIAQIHQCAALQDACMEAVFKEIKPGMRDIEASAIAEQVGHSHGSEQGIFLCASIPVGKSGHFAPRHYQNRIIQEGDYLAILVESNGAGGQYCELGRTCVLGKATEAMKEEMAFVERALYFAVDLLKPGASCSEIWDTYNRFMVENGRPAEQRLYCHGQGYDLVERPLVRFDESMKIQANMNLSCHPTYENATGFHWCCENVLIGENGNTLIHKFPRKVIEIN